MTDLGEPPVCGGQPCSAPRMSRGRAIVLVVAGLLVTGVVIGGLWAWIAPPIHGVVALTHDGDRVHDYLGNESQHFFDAAFLMLGLSSVLAVVAPVLVWQWRAHRGPGMVAGLSTGAVIAAAASTAVGALLVYLRYGVTDFAGAPVSEDNRVYYVTEAPPVFFGHTPLQIACTLLLPAATAALVYGVLAAATARDDLGGYPAIDSPQPPTVVVPAVGGAPSGR